MNKYQEVLKKVSNLSPRDMANKDIREQFEFLYNSLDKIVKWEDKEKPKYVAYEYDGYADGCPVYDIAHCPECGRYFDLDYEEKSNYCPDCGQRLNWEFRELEDEEEE